MTVGMPEKIALLKEAVDIAKHAAATSAAPSVLADVIQETYDRMIAIRESM